MRSPTHRTGKIPNARSSKKVRLEDVVVPTRPAGADDVVVDHSHDHRLDLSLSPPRNNIYIHPQETAAPAPIVPPPSPLPSPRPPTYTLMPPHSLYRGLVQPPPSSSIPVVSHAPPPPRLRKSTAHHPKKEGKSATVPAPFPWAENSRAKVRSLQCLVSNQIDTIVGEVQCKRCEKRYDVEYNLVEKFTEVWKFVAENRGSMNDRAPAVWMSPTLLTCKYCHQENSARPVVAEKKRDINWLFLLLGQMLGCCTLDQLKYFCKHTKNHRTGAKDRVLYLTYLGLCKQLNPTGPFDHPLSSLT